jgi:hypothetical protein
MPEMRTNPQLACMHASRMSLDGLSFALFAYWGLAAVALWFNFLFTLTAGPARRRFKVLNVLISAGCLAVAARLFLGQPGPGGAYAVIYAALGLPIAIFIHFGYLISDRRARRRRAESAASSGPVADRGGASPAQP